MFVLASLGNWGKQYRKTRHNVGHLFLDYLQSRLAGRVVVDSGAYRISRSGGPWTPSASVPVDTKLLQMQNSRFRQIFAGKQIDADPSVCDIIMVYPKSFMNTAGPAIKKALQDPNIPPSTSLIVVHDELDIPLGKFSMKLSGSANGHNGIKSCMQSMGHGDFPRIRIGIGRPDNVSHVDRGGSSLHRQQMVSDYVLQDFTGDECNTLTSHVFPNIEHMIIRNIMFKQKNQ